MATTLDDVPTSANAVSAIVGLLLLTACTGGTRTAARSTPDFGPVPTPSPTWSARSAPPLVGYPSPRLKVDASLAPNTGLGVGSRVRSTVVLKNEGDEPVIVPVFVRLSSGVVWELVEAPREAEPMMMCSELNGEPCAPDGVRWEQTVAAGATVTQVVTMEIVDFRCPARGDFHRESTITIGGPVAEGPNGYTAWLFFENDREDYVRATGAAPKKDWDCDVRYAT